MECICRKNSKGAFAFALLAVAFCAQTAFAQNAGFDLFQTGSGASVDLTSMGLGMVSLNGMPIQSSTANTDTMMQRTAAVPSGGGTVPVSLYALYMKSADPVTYNGQSADVYVTVNNTGGTIPQTVIPQPDALSPSTGSLTVTVQSGGGGGTFNSSITVNADVIFVTSGMSPTVSTNILGSSPAPSISLSSSNSTWSTTAPSGYPSPTAFPSGGFFPVTLKHINGPHPVVISQNPPSGGGGCLNRLDGATSKNSDVVVCVIDALPGPSQPLNQ